MKRYLFIPVVFLLFSCGDKNGSAKTESPKTNQTGTNVLAEFVFTEEMHNFGSLKSGEIVVFSFEFKNTGSNSLVIDDIITDCGCVKASSHKKTTPPGGAGIIEVEFDSSGLWGKQFKTIEIYANTKKTKQLAIFADVQNQDLEIKY